MSMPASKVLGRSLFASAIVVVDDVGIVHSVLHALDVVPSWHDCPKVAGLCLHTKLANREGLANGTVPGVHQNQKGSCDGTYVTDMQIYVMRCCGSCCKKNNGLLPCSETCPGDIPHRL